MAGALNNLGLFLWTRARLEEADRCYTRVIEILDQLPTTGNSPGYLTARASTLTNWVMVARERGDTKLAMELLKEAKSSLQRSLDEWPTNPQVIDFLFNQYWHVSETSIRAGQHEAAAKAVEAIVWAFPDQLRTYHYGAEQLLKCAILAEKESSEAEMERVDVDSAERIAITRESQSKPPADVYRERARELVMRAHGASDRTPDTTERFAWFLVTCEDEAFHDPARAAELATAVLNQIPDRGAAWLTLALAHYRLGDWQAADGALQKSVQYPRGGGARVCEWLILAMIRHAQGRGDEARQWHKKAHDWLAKNTTDFKYVHSLAAEAAALLGKESRKKTSSR
jgi:tetratricopeptide (TPR) repeat protein